MAGGREVSATAPRERMPLFVKAGAIVPMGRDVQWTGEDPQGPLTVHVFAGADGAFAVYEDQGEDMGYARGEFARVPLTWDDGRRVLTVGVREGRFPGMAATRRIGVVVHDGTASGPVFAAEPVRWVDYDGAAVELAF
jgi:alpha-D-xyloside xylohydrolase